MSQTRLATTPKIAIDARVLIGKRAGKGRYLAGILEGWLTQGYTEPVTLYGNLDPAQLPFRLPAYWMIEPVPNSTHGSVVIGMKMLMRGEDVLLSTAAYSASVFSTKPVVTVIHDLSVFRCPEARPSFRIAWGEKLFLRPALSRSTRILAVSAFTKRELIAYFDLSPAAIDVASNAVDPSFKPAADRTGHDLKKLAQIQQTYHLPKEFILFVGTLEPRKNIPRILEAYANLPEELQRRYPLVLVGKRGWSTDEIDRMLYRLETDRRVIRVDYVPDPDLPYFYNAATLAVYPSLYEGFGLPALEALASGTPLITASTTSLPEVVGDAALTVDPHDTGALTTAIVHLLQNPKERLKLAAAGPLQARQFTWPTAAAVVHNALTTVAGSK